MIGEFGLIAIDPGGLNESLPAPVSQEAKEAQAASAPHMAVDLRCRLLVLLEVRLVCKGCCVLEQDLLSARRFEMHLLDQGEQFLPSLSVRASILSRVESRQLPPLAAGKDIDRLLKLDCGLVQDARGSRPTAILPKIGTEIVVPPFQARLFK